MGKTIGKFGQLEEQRMLYAIRLAYRWFYLRRSGAEFTALLNKELSKCLRHSDFLRNLLGEFGGDAFLAEQWLERGAKRYLNGESLSLHCGGVGEPGDARDDGGSGSDEEPWNDGRSEGVQTERPSFEFAKMGTRASEARLARVG